MWVQLVLDGRGMVPKSTEQQFDETVAKAAQLAIELTAGAVTSVSFDVQQSREVPWRLVVPDEILPLVGLAYLDADPPAGGQTEASVAVSREGVPSDG